MIMIAGDSSSSVESRKKIMEGLDYWNKNTKPLSVLFEVTTRCNLSCQHCYHVGHCSDNELNLREINRLLDQLAAAGVVYFSITGG